MFPTEKCLIVLVELLFQNSRRQFDNQRFFCLVTKCSLKRSFGSVVYKLVAILQLLQIIFNLLYSVLCYALMVGTIRLVTGLVILNICNHASF